MLQSISYNTATPFNHYCQQHTEKNKFENLKKKIFPHTSIENVKKLMIDKESLNYITFASDAFYITKIICENLSSFPAPVNIAIDPWNRMTSEQKVKNLVMTDMTAGVGGNVYSFAKYFKYVNAIEINPIVYSCLKNNISVYNLDNINCYNDNSTKLLIENDDIGQDIIFFDPPWGGKDYKYQLDLKLKFGLYSIENICRLLLNRPSNKMIVLKLPNNYDYKYFIDELNMYTIERYQLHKFTILVVKSY